MVIGILIGIPTMPVAPAVGVGGGTPSGPAFLREDSGYILREDGSFMLRES